MNPRQPLAPADRAVAEVVAASRQPHAPRGARSLEAPFSRLERVEAEVHGIAAALEHLEGLLKSHEDLSRGRIVGMVGALRDVDAQPLELSVRLPLFGWFRLRLTRVPKHDPGQPR